MGTLVGNFMALLLLAISVAVGLFSFEYGAIGYASIAYVVWILLWAGNFFTKPQHTAPFCSLLTQAELDAYRNYHTYILFQGAAEAFSALLNALRVTSTVLAVICFWKGLPWVGGVLIVYFFLVSGLVLRFNPRHYMQAEARKGNDIANRELSLIESVQKKRIGYNANKIPTKAMHSEPVLSGLSFKEDSDWLFQHIMKTGEAFLASMQQNNLISRQPNAILAMAIRPDVEAVLLAYKLAVTAYRFHQNVPASNVLLILRVAMAGIFLKTIKEDFQQEVHQDSIMLGKEFDDSLPPDMRKAALKLAETRLKSADTAITAALTGLRANSPSPFSAFYTDLAPAFGGKGSPEELERRYGNILKELFAKLEIAIGERLSMVSA